MRASAEALARAVRRATVEKVESRKVRGARGSTSTQKDTGPAACNSNPQQRECPENENKNNPGKEEGDRPNARKRSLTIEERSALQGYATHHNKLTKDVDIATVRADGGVEKWALKVEKKTKFEPPDPKQRRVEPMQRERKVFWIKGPGGTMVESAGADEQEEHWQQQQQDWCYHQERE